MTSKWLSSSLESVKVFDATWFFPTLGKSALEAYRAQHVPGARFLDIDAIDDTGKDWPHMLPTPAGFESAMRGAGVNAEDHVVVYDATAIMCAAPRMYWSLRWVTDGDPDPRSTVITFVCHIAARRGAQGNGTRPGVGVGRWSGRLDRRRLPHGERGPAARHARQFRGAPE